MSEALEIDGWELESALERHLQSPDTFEIPSSAELNNLQAGDMVKLLFLLAGEDDQGSYVQCERMWVTLLEVNSESYVGQLESLPITSDILRPGSIVKFDQHHICSILKKSDKHHPSYQLN